LALRQLTPIAGPRVRTGTAQIALAMRGDGLARPAPSSTLGGMEETRAEPGPSLGPGRLTRFLPIAAPDFWRLWFVGVVVFLVRWLEMLAMGVFVYQHTGSAFLVAILTMMRLLPMALFGAIMGAVADHLDRRVALVFVVVSLLLSSATIALLAYLGILAIWHLAVASFLNGTAWATDNPVRRIMLGESVGTGRVGMAMSIDIGTNNASRMLGPILGGVLLASVGIEGTFLLSVALYAVAGLVALRVRYRATAPAADAEPLFRRVGEGLRIVRRDPKLIGTLVITVIFNVFGWPFTSMIPVIGQDNLALGPEGIGLLASMDGLGALCGAVAIALLARPTRYARIYISGSMVYMLLLPVFALMSVPLLSGGALFFTGVASACFSIMQSTLIYLLAPHEIRSRVFGVLSVCIGSGPIGFIHLGLLADAIGARGAITTSAVEGIIALLLTARLWGKIWRGAVSP
jgi:MFS family permease